MLDERRRELLAAIGIEVYCLRVAPAGAAAPPSTIGITATARIVIACPGDARRDARLAKSLVHVVRALGVGAGEAAWIETDGDRVTASLPDVACYLMLGAAAARACSAQLPLERQGAATIAVSGEPGELFRDGAGRRALWQSLKPLLHRLRSG